MNALRARILSWPALAVVVAIAVLAAVAGPGLARTVGLTGEAQSPADASFARVCRDHGGTPSFAPGSGDYVKDARSCQIAYGGERYEMYAVHPEGFSEREAADARHACTLLARQRRLDAARAAAAGTDTDAVRVVWHARSAICES